MGQAYIPTQTLDYFTLGTTTIIDPTLILVVSGVGYANGYTVSYTNGFRNFFPIYEAGNIYLYCHTVAYGEDIPAYSISNIEVYIID